MRLRALAGCEQAAALFEFAIVAPLLLTLLLGGYALEDALTCSRKVAITARSVADLTSRYSSVASSDVATIMAASSQILWPYASSKAGIVVSEIQVTTTTTATVVWSQAQNATARTTGATFTVPTNIGAVGAYLLVGEVSYAYTAPIPYGSFKSISLYQAVYMSPRVSNSVPLQ